MAMTKVEAAKLTQDMLLRGVIETIITESMILELLPFMEVTGTSVTYNREATLPAATFYDVGDTWTEATPTFTQVTATLKIIGGDADVDNFLQATYADPNDVEAEVQACTARPTRAGRVGGESCLTRVCKPVWHAVCGQRVTARA